jgi:hypothetical protein
MPMKRKLDDDFLRGAASTSDLSLMLRTALGKGDQIQEADFPHFQDSLVNLASALSSADRACHFSLESSKVPSP